MKWVKSDNKLSKDGDSGIWEAYIDYFEDSGSRWYSRICLYAGTKQEVKEMRKKILKALNKTEEKQNEENL